MKIQSRLVATGFLAAVGIASLTLACGDDPSATINPGITPARADASRDGAPTDASRETSLDASDGGGETTLDASDGGSRVDAADPSQVGVVGVLGRACAPVGALGCSGHDQKGQLICGVDGRWEANGVCAGNLNCDSRDGRSAGSCQPIERTCDERRGGDAWCSSGDAVSRCDLDRLSSTVETCWGATPKCLGAKCVECTPGTTSCDWSGLPRACDPTGHWVTQSACGAETRCHEGACVACIPGETRCSALGNYVERCSSFQTWTYDARCAYTCTTGACTGSCTPGTLSCSFGLQYCKQDFEYSYLGTTCNPSCTTGNFTMDLAAPAHDVLVQSSGRKWRRSPEAPATWASAKATCEGAGYRLPTAEELRSTVVPYWQSCSPRIDQVAFALTGTPRLWSSEIVTATDGGTAATVMDSANGYTTEASTGDSLPFLCVK